MAYGCDGALEVGDGIYLHPGPLLVMAKARCREQQQPQLGDPHPSIHALCGFVVRVLLLLVSERCFAWVLPATWAPAGAGCQHRARPSTRGQLCNGKAIRDLRGVVVWMWLSSLRDASVCLMLPVLLVT
ncbi:hypothetical protein Agub_g8202 [Astrephomene gubernaculifera]|uniref:Uncharacterized protein n=1 Tax=Astrephomene gubernaculifera TaxID=47775 RepID=A0AAD3DT05_9CHLO|nr:hypothetical protein Agub_g8202 [Astrephomene gubernaculifera]